MTKVIMLNGPRSVGKDYIADRCIERLNSTRKLPIAFFIKRAALQMHGIAPHFAGMLEGYKDRPLGDVLHDLREPLASRTPRELYIEYGDYMRREEGDDFFAKMWAESADLYRGYGTLFVTDVRFQCEVDEAVKIFGISPVLLVRVRRENYDWTNDIGTYVSHKCAIDFFNDDMTSDPGERLLDCIKARMI